MARWAHEAAFDTEIRAAHEAFPSVPVPVIKGVIAAESGFRRDAVRAEPQIADASIGLMQVLMRTAQGLGFQGTVETLKTPALNVYYGTKLLAQNYAATGSWPAAISAYNGGLRPHLGFGKPAAAPTRVCVRWSTTVKDKCEQWHTTPAGEFANQAYVNKVLEHVRYFEQQGGEYRPPFLKAGIGLPLVKPPQTWGQAALLAVALGSLLLVRRTQQR